MFNLEIDHCPIYFDLTFPEARNMILRECRDRDVKHFAITRPGYRCDYHREYHSRWSRVIEYKDSRHVDLVYMG